MWLLKISLILVDSLLKVGPGKTKKILEKSLKSHGIFSQIRCMNPELKVHFTGQNHTLPIFATLKIASMTGHLVR